jgi:hypothetical protein
MIHIIDELPFLLAQRKSGYNLSRLMIIDVPQKRCGRPHFVQLDVLAYYLGGRVVLAKGRWHVDMINLVVKGSIRIAR